ncbi:MAG: hypothetical protein DI538_09325 [Azospira oryzae]|jgi:hypothetical protein|nr:MAG: hypothetical protein DI538_09325 [Azospira oryzae]
MKAILPFILLLSSLVPLLAQSKNKATAAIELKQGKVIDEHLVSTILKENRIGLNPDRKVKIYLPPGYSSSTKSYPVIYYLHSLGSSAEQLFADGKLTQVMERAFNSGVINEVIIVAADYSSPTIGSLFENSVVSGRWLDFIVKELVPFIDNTFRTLRTKDSRALAGDFIGGRGALKLAMTHSETFSMVYALHPVATGMGYTPWTDLQLDWQKIYQARTFDEIGNDFRSRIFVAVSQAFVPDINHPPFYGKLFVEQVNGQFRLNTENMMKAKAGFHLEETLNESVTHLKAVHIAFDWGRFDSNQDHVYSNQTFSRKLRDLGIEHEAEEYNGDPWSKNWTADGRVYTRMLPFFASHLVFDEKK